MKPRAPLLLFALLVASPALRAQVDLEGPLAPQGFAIPETRAARERLDGATKHLAAGRLRPAIDELQALIEGHAGDVLGASRPQQGGRPSLLPVHRGAAVQARELLLSLSAEGRALYRERYEEAARTALLRAIAARDRAALCEIARRWPLCESAARAWLALGDLELEAGEPHAARDGWREALELALVLDAQALDGHIDASDPARWNDLAGRALPTGRALALAAARRGSALLAAGLEESAAAVRNERMRGELRLPGAGEGLGPPPGRSADVWPNPVKFPFHKLAAAGSLFPVRAADVVLLSTSMRLIAVDAYTGQLSWDSGEVPGWESLDPVERDEFLEGVDTDHALIAPAATARVAVAALQIPVTHVQPENFQRIPITKILPDRRLFAFDLESGRPLWNHLPPPSWDGESGSFAQRMRVAGPPVIAGSRVLAPMVRMQGRIDYHVGCFDLATGALLWSTGVISGQRETNMFGRALTEFSSPPLRVEGQRVIALTQLGAIAALDLYTGEILWEALYDQIPLPKGRQYDPTLRRATWRNTPPVVAAGLVIATPVDGDDLVALDLESGAVAWSLRRERLRAMVRRDARLDLLLGADDTTVYLAGDRIAALEAPAGLQRQPPAAARWVFEDEALAELGRFRPVLARDRVIVPTNSARIEIDRLHGKRTLTAAWVGTPGGNLLVDDGALFKATTRDLTGYLEWETLLARARRDAAERPNDSAAALVLAQRLAGRGIALWKAEGKSDDARRVLSEAREILERFTASSGAGQTAAATLSRELFGVLRAEARVRADLADTAGALRLLERSRALAPERGALRDVLVEELSLLEVRPGAAERERRLATLELLDREVGDLALACEPRPREGGSLDPRESLAGLVPRPGGEAAGDAPRLVVPVGLWVRIERARVAAETADAAAELRALGELLQRWSPLPLGDETVGEAASRRVAALLREAPPRAVQGFETAARERLARALAEDDRAGLAAVGRGWPHTSAAREANDALLGRAQAELDLGTVAAIVRSEMPEGLAFERAGPREIGLALRLARAAERAGNVELAQGILVRLAAAQPDARSPLAEDEGATLASLAPPAAPIAQRDPPPGRFGLSFGAVSVLGDEHEILGRLPPSSSPAGPAALLIGRSGGQRSGRLVALAEGEGDRPLWTNDELDAPRLWGGRVAIAAERVVVATPTRVVALDAHDGRPSWSFAETGAAPEGVVASDGVVLCPMQRADERRELVALDARGGAELWRIDTSDPTLYRRPLVGDGRVVLLPNPPHARLVVLDLFTGRRSFELELPWAPKDAAASLVESAWIESGILVLPWFFEVRNPERNHVVGVDLGAGRIAWRVPIQDRDGLPRSLSSIVQHGERTFLVVWTVQTFGNAIVQGELRELSVTQGTLAAPLFGMTLSPSDELIGVGKSERVRLPTPQLFIKSPARGARATLVRLIHLEQGERWAHVLPVPADEIYNARLPLPAVSETAVAFAYTELRRRDRSERPVTSLVLVDARTGVARDARILSDRMGRHDDVELVPFGESLVVNGSQQLEVLR